MHNMIKNIFDKVEMSPVKKEMIRNEIANSSKLSSTWIRYVVGVAACMALLVSVPSTRTMMVQAAQYVSSIFHTADGSEVVYEKTDDETKFSVEDSDINYVKVKDGKLYFVYEGKNIDITDKCSEDSYYRYEVSNHDGGKSVILVGGTVENPGWVELIFDKDGKYVFNKMSITGEKPAWVENAMNQEGVPCGNPELDNKLTK